MSDKAAEVLDDAIRDMLDIATGWSRGMTDKERLAIIADIGNTALRATLAARNAKRPPEGEPR